MRRFTCALFLLLACAVDVDGAGDSGSSGGVDEDVEFRTQIAYTSESHDKCCTTGTDTGCVDDTNNVCPAGKTRTGCVPCNYQECLDSTIPYTWGEYGWHTSVDGSPWDCRGFSWNIATGAMIDDDCSTADCLSPSDSDSDAHFCYSASPWSTTNECPANDQTLYGQISLADGQVGKMCCKPNAAADNDYQCMLWGASCGLSGPQGHSTSAYCLPCPGSGQDYPNSGAWDLVNDPAEESTTDPHPPGEWFDSLDCGADGKFAVDGGANECRITLYECGGILVNTNGTLLSEDCPNWP